MTATLTTEPPTEKPAVKNGRILLLEDNYSLLRLYSKTLIKAKFTVHEAMTIADAERLLQTETFDFFICDMRIRDAHSAELLRVWVDRLKAKGTIIVAMSAFEQYRRLCSDMGIEHFMPKPITPSSLLSVMNELSD